MLPLYNNKDLVKKLKSLKVKAKVEKGAAWAWLCFVAALFAGRNAGYVKAVIADEAQIISAGLVMLGFGGTHIEERNAKPIKELADDIAKETDQECKIKSLKDIKVISADVKVGEDLESINIAPIYKEGYYVVIKSRPSAFVLSQIEEEGRQRVQILYPSEANEVIDELAQGNRFVRKNIKALKRVPEKIPETFV